MSDSQITGRTPGRRPETSCARTAGVSCLTLLIVLVIALVWLRQQFGGPNFDRQAVCLSNAQEIGRALSRYAIRNQKYPDKLADLYPDFTEKRSVLHCPSDPRPSNVVSYDYYPPKIDAPDSTIVLTCRRHVLIRGAVTVLVLTKGGDVSIRPIKPVYNKPDAADKAEKKSAPKPDEVKTSPDR